MPSHLMTCQQLDHRLLIRGFNDGR